MLETDFAALRYRLELERYASTLDHGAADAAAHAMHLLFVAADGRPGVDTYTSFEDGYVGLDVASNDPDQLRAISVVAGLPNLSVVDTQNDWKELPSHLVLNSDSQ